MNEWRITEGDTVATADAERTTAEGGIDTSRQFREGIGRAVRQQEEKSNYWKYQVPLLGDYYRAQDDYRFWQDYKKVTGHTPRYPGRQYAYHGQNLINSATNKANRVYRNMYK